MEHSKYRTHHCGQLGCEAPCAHVILAKVFRIAQEF
jgi:hypothetical protein